MSALERYFNRLWYEDHWQQWLFWPASKLAESVVARRRRQVLQNPPSPLKIPVIIIGNLTVGGTGKTPLLLFLVDELQKKGLRVGVISRGYGGKASYPLHVTKDTLPAECGDEPALIVRRTGVPMVVDPQRARAALALAAAHSVDVILSDDGLQHYPLSRQLEVLVVDGQRGFGNQHMLPMGPLREPLDRLDSLRFVVVNGAASESLQQELSRHRGLSIYSMQIQPGKIRRLAGSESADSVTFASRQVTAVAGIGNPDRFFNTLKSMGIVCDKAVFADHYRYSAEDFQPYQHTTVLMTEKDAVKVRPQWLADGWYLSVDASLTGPLVDDIMRALSLQ